MYYMIVIDRFSNIKFICPFYNQYVASKFCHVLRWTANSVLKVPKYLSAPPFPFRLAHT